MNQLSNYFIKSIMKKLLLNTSTNSLSCFNFFENKSDKMQTISELTTSLRHLQKYYEYFYKNFIKAFSIEFSLSLQFNNYHINLEKIYESIFNHSYTPLNLLGLNLSLLDINPYNEIQSIDFNNPNSSFLKNTFSCFLDSCSESIYEDDIINTSTLNEINFQYSNNKFQTNFSELLLECLELSNYEITLFNIHSEELNIFFKSTQDKSSIEDFIAELLNATTAPNSFYNPFFFKIISKESKFHLGNQEYELLVLDFTPCCFDYHTCVNLDNDDYKSLFLSMFNSIKNISSYNHKQT